MDCFAQVHIFYIDSPLLDSSLLVYVFPTIFPTNLTGLSLEHYITLAIDLRSGFQLIYIMPYYIAFTDLKQLNIHI